MQSTMVTRCGTCGGEIVDTWTGAAIVPGAHVCPPKPAPTAPPPRAVDPIAPVVRCDELTPCPKCERMSTLSHQRGCNGWRPASYDANGTPAKKRPKPKRKNVLAALRAAFAVSNAPPCELPLVVTVDHRTETLNRLSNEHYYTRAKRRASEYRATSRALAPFGRPALPKPGEPPIVVRFVRMSAQQCDDDNLAGAFKIPRDCCADWLGVSDGPKETRVVWRYGQEMLRERAPVSRGGVGGWASESKHVYVVKFRIEITKGDG